MNTKRDRPFYTEFAWAFDLLIDRPVRKECAAIGAWLVERGVVPGGEILDAGCGTGRYARELARRGYLVHGVDASPELIDVAMQANTERASVSFAVGDLLAPAAHQYDAILCRGVLNDVVDDDDRAAVVARFSEALRPAGVLILDVRDWELSAERKAREPLFRKTVATARGTLTFTSVTELDPGNRRLIVAERHTLVNEGREHSSDYRFVMRCWTRDEVSAALSRSGFDSVAYFGAYADSVEAGTTDRVVAVAVHGERVIQDSRRD